MTGEGPATINAEVPRSERSWAHSLGRAKDRIARFLQRGDRQETTGDEPVQLKDLLVEAANLPRKAGTRLPQRIDLGGFRDEAERLIQLTLEDPERVEYGSSVFTDGRCRLLIPVEPIRGEPGQVQLPTPPKGLSAVMDLHSHRTDEPFSLGDIASVGAIWGPLGKRSLASLISTPTTTMLMVRYSDARVESETQIGPIMDEVDELLFEAQHNTQSIMYFLTRVAPLVHVAIYSGPRGTRIVRMAL